MNWRVQSSMTATVGTLYCCYGCCCCFPQLYCCDVPTRNLQSDERAVEVLVLCEYWTTPTPQRILVVLSLHYCTKTLVWCLSSQRAGELVENESVRPMASKSSTQQVERVRIEGTWKRPVSWMQASPVWCLLESVQLLLLVCVCCHYR